MSLIMNKVLEASKTFIYENGRLLERQLYEVFFAAGKRQSALKALLAYQNDDGGFGNGIEPDLLCPDSTAIGAETAMVVLDLLDYQGPEIIEPLAAWLVANQHEEGYILHPPRSLENYPFQPWWWNPDPNRILVIVALLKKWGIEHDQLFSRARNYYEAAEAPEPDNFYSYPFFAYLRYCSDGETDKALLAEWISRLPALLEKHGDHYPLFSRYWFYARDLVSPETLKQEAAKFKSGLQEDGGLTTPYPELPWWRPIFTLDGLIMLKQAGLLAEEGERL